MAQELEKSSFGNFGIQDTMEMGLGNAQLLSDLISPETSTGNPEDIEEIVKTVDAPSPAKKPEVIKGKEIVPRADGEEITNQDTLRNFLNDVEEEEEEEDSLIPAKKPISASDDDNEGDVSDETTFTGLSRDLFKLGVFTETDDDANSVISTPEQFLERFTAEKKRGAIEMIDSLVGQFGEDYRDAFDAIYVKGVNPKEYFGTYNEIVNLSEINLEEENNQESIVRRALSDQGFEPEDITSEIERLKNYGDLESMAKRHHKVLVKKDVAKLQDLEVKAEADKALKTQIRNQYIQNVQGVIQDKMKTKEFDGIPLNPKLASELQDFLLVDKYRTPSGETLTDFDKAILDLKRPENHAMKVKFGLLLKILEKDPTLSTIQKAGVTKKTNSLFEEVARQTKKQVTTNALSSRENKSWFQ